MEVQLNKLFGKADSPLGRVDEEVPTIWRVDVLDERLKGEPLCIESGKLHVGMIGRQDGANFCANGNFDRFAVDQKDFIVSEVKRIHGSASLEIPVALPDLPEPPEEEYDDYEDADDIDDD